MTYKKYTIYEIKTLNELHNDKINYFKNEYKKIKDINKKIKEINTDKISYLKMLLLLRKKNELENCFYELDYYDKIKNILKIYYTNNNNIVSENAEEILSKKKINDDETLKNKYIYIINPNKLIQKKKIDIIKCLKCNIDRLFVEDEGFYVCRNCGEIEYNIISSYDNNKIELNSEKTKFPYRKINHLIEKLNQYQSKEKIKIPDNVFEIIQQEIKKQKISKKILSPSVIKNILKKNKLNLYYENSQYIYSKITNIYPPKLTLFLENRLKEMFNLIQKSFNKFKPLNRSNFLNYDYVIHKMFLILNETKHAKYFNLLKSFDKLKQQDIIWKKICNDLNWEFHSSF